jgi:hypothetical protein
LTVDSNSKIRRFLEDEIAEERIRLWTEKLRGFQPLKREEMLWKYRDRLMLKKLNDFVERVSFELRVTRDCLREGIRDLQEKHGLRANYNQVKDAALKQLIKYSRLQEEGELPQNVGAVATSKIEEHALEAGCRVIHELLEPLPLHDFRTPTTRLPRNAIYFFYEEGEFCRHFDVIRPRIVRVGTHREQNRFPSRIRQHFGGNKNGSVFRKHLGGAVLRRRNPDDFRLDKWLKQDTPTFKEVEELVTNKLAADFTFKCIAVEDKKERLDLEERLIATLAKCPGCEPSMEWLGHYAASEEIRQSGLWNVQHVYSNKRMTQQYLSKLRELAHQELKRMMSE